MESYKSIINKNADLNDPTEKTIFAWQYQSFLIFTTKQTKNRLAANNFYIAINSVIISTLGILNQGNTFLTANLSLIIILLFLGIGSIWVWLRTLYMYYTVNYKIYLSFNEFEKYLPSKIITSFYDDVSRKETDNKVKNSFLLDKETWVPYFFLAAYTIYGFVNLYRLFY